MNLFVTALAESNAATGAAADAAQQQAAASTLWGTIIYFVVIIALFYFIAILPQKKRDKKTREMLDNIVPGDEIITIGGINGKVLSIKDDKFVIEVGADRVKMTVEKWAIKECVTVHD